MCGGRGTRLDTKVEKPLFRIGGVPMVGRVVGALEDSAVERIIAATSPNAPETQSCLDVPCIETPGEGYVADLDAALNDDQLSQPVLTVAIDLPLLDGEIVDRVLDRHSGGSLSVLVPASLKRELGVSDDTTFESGNREVAPTGINVVGDGPDDAWLTWDRRVAVNVNTLADARVAEQWL
ncbi:MULTISPECIES: NTP transferase domain-containing protein [Haloarcula]|nr:MULTISPECIES: NTP transferase domain-containing protein [Haloarcula]EMA15480.1 4-diphosphocytidyl-2C-methyl-D-erythritol synthase [Haloarcula sinaiiensis ATCC 33800]QUJ73662.1 NTP transferase domain-containing protein [Haloarcula sinaiiensis ATCC 33800]